MKVVLDASAAIEIVLNRPEAGSLRLCLEQCSRVLSTDLYKAEVANTLWKYNKAGLLAKDTVLDLLKLCQNLVDDYFDIREFNEESLMESIHLDHAIYDMLYLTLARRTGSVLLTMDKKLRKIAESQGVETEGVR